MQKLPKSLTPVEVIEQNDIQQILSGDFQGAEILHMSLIDFQVSIKEYQNFKVKNFQENPEYLLKKVCAVVALFNNSIKVTTEKMSAMEIYEFARWFIETYSHESSGDLIMCLKLAKSGHYGKIYNRKQCP